MGSLEEKIVEQDLRSFARSDDNAECRSVIVELNVPPARLEMQSGRRVPHRRSTKLDPNEIPRDEKGAMDDLENKLHALGVTRNVTRLDVAQAFVVDLSPDQLRSVASLPAVGTIRPNRTHRVSAH